MFGINLRTDLAVVLRPIVAFDDRNARVVQTVGLRSVAVGLDERDAKPRVPEARAEAARAGEEVDSHRRLVIIRHHGSPAAAERHQHALSAPRITRAAHLAAVM